MDISNQIAKYEEQLPRRKTVSWSSIFTYTAGIASILGVVFSPSLFGSGPVTIVYSIFLVSLVSVIILHTYLTERRKLDRFAQSTLYSHYVNHIIRDSLAAMEQNNFSSTKQDLKAIINSIAQCFSLLTAKQCRCSLKELNHDMTITTVVRDKMSEKRTHICPSQDHIIHKLKDNTDFFNLWYSIDGCSRYFFSSNLIKLFLYDNYKNSSFNVLGVPQKISILGRPIAVKKWTLPYKSTIVFPIRYFSCFEPPSRPEDHTPHPHRDDFPHWKFWGFLCIDCNSRNIFDEEFSTELGAAFSDILYIYLSQTKLFLDKVAPELIKPIQDHPATTPAQVNHRKKNKRKR